MPFYARDVVFPGFKGPENLKKTWKGGSVHGKKILE